MSTKPGFYCHANGLSKIDRERYNQVLFKLPEARVETLELPNSYGARLQSEGVAL